MSGLSILLQSLSKVLIELEVKCICKLEVVTMPMLNELQKLELTIEIHWMSFDFLEHI